MTIKKILSHIWHDPVWSKVIASVIISITVVYFSRFNDRLFDASVPETKIIKNDLIDNPSIETSVNSKIEENAEPVHPINKSPNNLNIKITQDNIEIIPVIIKNALFGEMFSYNLSNKEFSFYLPDIGITYISASTRGFFFDPIIDTGIMGFDEKQLYPISKEHVSCFATGKSLEGNDSDYLNISYAFERSQWYYSGSRINIKKFEYDDFSRKNAFEIGQTNVFVVFWINKNKDVLVDIDEILFVELQILGKGTLQY